MTQTIDFAGEPLFFPHSMETDDRGVILPRPFDELAAFASAVAQQDLLPFVRRLIDGTKRRRREAKWSAVNVQRLQLAQLCIERAMSDGTIASPQ